MSQVAGRSLGGNGLAAMLGVAIQRLSGAINAIARTLDRWLKRRTLN